MKRLITLILVVTMLCGVLVTSVGCDNSDLDSSLMLLDFKIVDGVYGVRLASSIAHYVSEITIPGYYNGLPVAHILDSGFAGAENLEHIELPDTILTIGASAFENCEMLSEIKIPSSVTIISESAFYGCSRLEKIKFENGSQLLEIEENAFYGCSRLEKLKLPSGLRRIGANAFGNCIYLETVNIPESLISSSGAFKGSNSIRKINYSGSKNDWNCYLRSYTFSDTVMEKRTVYYNPVFNEGDSIREIIDELLSWM